MVALPIVELLLIDLIVKPIDLTPLKKYPTVLWIHGGPTSQYDFSF
jgi:dipeptidyl aminopeptidase/acylaminoacyl peptidase